MNSGVITQGPCAQPRWPGSQLPSSLVHLTGFQPGSQMRLRLTASLWGKEQAEGGEQVTVLAGDGRDSFKMYGFFSIPRLPLRQG